MQFNGILEPYGLFAHFLNDSLSGFHLGSSIYLLVLVCRSLISLLHIASPWGYVPAEVYPSQPLSIHHVYLAYSLNDFLSVSFTCDSSPKLLGWICCFNQTMECFFCLPPLSSLSICTKLHKTSSSFSQLLISHTVIFYSCYYNPFLATRSPIPFRLI
jgi:hypothetical protein